MSLIISSNSSSRPGQLNLSLFPVNAFCKWIGKGLRSEPLWSQRNRELSSSDLWGKLTGKDAGKRDLKWAALVSTEGKWQSLSDSLFVDPDLV